MIFKYLKGGRKNTIMSIGNRVHRPAGPWSNQVHSLLIDLRKQNFLKAPEPFGFDDKGNEIVSLIQGEVSNYPLSVNAASNEALISAAKLLRDYHHASQNFLTTHVTDDSKWQLPCRSPREVICHGDFAPYNVVLDGKKAIGIIDFDTCHPGPRGWDVAYALYRWSPFMNPKNKDGFGTLEEQITRARLFCDAYGLPENSRRMMPSLMIERLQALVNFMLAKAQAGNETYKLNMDDGHHIGYLADIEYIDANKSKIANDLPKKRFNHE